MITGRPYPIQIYLYACDKYSTNPSLGQRTVAKATQDKFNLEKFSHSTVCRSFKTVEQIQKQALDRYFGEEFQPNDIENQSSSNKPESENSIPESASENSVPESENENSNQEVPRTERRFPSVEDTLGRRLEVAIFLQSFHKSITEDDKAIETAAQHFVEHLFGKSEKLRN